MREWEPAEVLLLVDGLPDNSRYKGRLVGADSGWKDTDYLLFDVRNILENVRTGLAGKKGKFREWDHYPGAVAQKRMKREKYLKSLRKLVAEGKTEFN